MSSLPSLRNTRLLSTLLWVSLTHTKKHSHTLPQVFQSHCCLNTLLSLASTSYLTEVLFDSGLSKCLTLFFSLCLCRCWSCWRLSVESGCGFSRLWLTVTSCWRNTKTRWRAVWSFPQRSLRRRHRQPYRASAPMVNTTHISASLFIFCAGKYIKTDSRIEWTWITHSLLWLPHSQHKQTFIND